MYYSVTRKNELYHHGILGQKWGIRRYQNPDGSLTPAGVKRYYNPDGSLTRHGKKYKKQLDKIAAEKKKQAEKEKLSEAEKKRKAEVEKAEYLMKTDASKLTSKELAEKIKRIERENALKEIQKKQLELDKEVKALTPKTKEELLEERERERQERIRELMFTAAGKITDKVLETGKEAFLKKMELDSKEKENAAKRAKDAADAEHQKKKNALELQKEKLNVLKLKYEVEGKPKTEHEKRLERIDEQQKEANVRKTLSEGWKIRQEGRVKAVSADQAKEKKKESSVSYTYEPKNTTKSSVPLKTFDTSYGPRSLSRISPNLASSNANTLSGTYAKSRINLRMDGKDYWLYPDGKTVLK